jgi:NADH-quinone oxidoreductase subunit I
MGAVREYFAAIGRSIATLGDGMAVTFSYLLRKPTTIQYPDRSGGPVVAMLPERSRGILENDIERCTGCGMCAKQCSIDCIKVVVEKNLETKTRILTSFKIDIAKCMFCGHCVDACPVGSLRHSHEFEGAMYDIDRLTFEFVDEPRPVAKPPKKGVEVVGKPLGSIARNFLYEADGQPPEPKPRPKPAEKKPEVKAEPEKKPEAPAEPEKKPEVKAEPEKKPEAPAEPEKKPETQAEPEKKPEAPAEPGKEPKKDPQKPSEPDSGNGGTT